MHFLKGTNLSASIITKWIVTLVATVLVLPSAWADDEKRRKPIQSVIVMVPDGCAQSIQTVARWHKGAPLILDGLNTGMVRTHMANSVVTGSAAAATAFASGYKTTARFVGLGHRPDDILTGVEMPLAKPYQPLATVLEGANQLGKATGLVATSRVTHATPAAYSAHVLDRGWENEIMEHMVYNGIDVVFGGGKRHLLPKEKGGLRTDGEDLLKVLSDRGYQWVETRKEMLALKTGQAWGLFASSHMAAHLDNRALNLGQPTLAEMTAKAIELLSQNHEGFFLMVEGSQIDWAGHANDAVHMVTDFLAFDEAVGVAVDFARTNGRTLVVIFPDHDTGGLSVGNYSSNSGLAYATCQVEDLLGPLHGMRITAWTLAGKVKNKADPQEIKAVISQWWGIDATDEDARQIIAAYEARQEKDFHYAVSQIISKNHTLFGWTTHGHNGTDVPLWSYGPGRPVGLYNNTDLAKVISNALGFDLDSVSKRLYVDVRDVFKNYQIDKTDPANPILRVGMFELSTSKDILREVRNGVVQKEYNLGGIIVDSPEAVWYVNLANGQVSKANDHHYCDNVKNCGRFVKDWESVFIPVQAVRCVRRGICGDM